MLDQAGRLPKKNDCSESRARPGSASVGLGKGTELQVVMVVVIQVYYGQFILPKLAKLLCSIQIAFSRHLARGPGC